VGKGVQDFSACTRFVFLAFNFLIVHTFILRYLISSCQHPVAYLTMDGTKEPITMHSFLEDDVHGDEVVTEKKGTGADQHDMARMGKTQETRVCPPPKLHTSQDDADLFHSATSGS